jgi:hypothetical protein
MCPQLGIGPKRNMMILQSVITCPNCGNAKTETMPTDACWVFYECKGCGMLLKPKAGDCCVFCSFGNVPVSSHSGGTVERQ